MPKRKTASPAASADRRAAHVQAAATLVAARIAAAGPSGKVDVEAALVDAMNAIQEAMKKLTTERRAARTAQAGEGKEA